MKYITTIGIILIFIFACENKQQEQNEFCQQLKEKRSTPLFSPEKPFVLASIQKEDGYLNMEDLIMCADWKLSEEDLYKIVKSAHFVSEEVWESCLEHLRCKMTATLVQEQDTFTLGVNAGGWFYLRNADTTLRFEAVRPENKPFFLSKKMFNN